MKLAAAALAVVALATAPAAAAPLPRVDHVVVIVFENEERDAVLGSGSAPTFDRLARDYVDLTNYHALTHPSLPNYVALVSGSTHGISDDCTDCVIERGTTIGDELTRAGRTWAAYAEGYPSSPRFAKKHMPFLYFPRDRTHVHPLTALRPTRLPAFALVAPDLCHDMHDCGVATGDAWLRRTVQPLLRAPRTVVFILFDEGTTNAGGGGHVAAIAAGTAVARRARYTLPTGHYAVLRTIEDALGVPPLGASAGARPLRGIWRENA
jgi:phosphatidylinositol-3-phosphatase